MKKYQKIVTTGCLIKNGKVLLIQRADTEEFLPNYYEMPGGKCDFDENPEDSLRREFQEETSISIRVGKPYRTFSYITDNGCRHTVEIIFLVENLNPISKINLGKDHVAYTWADEKNLDQYQITDEMKTSVIEVLRESQRE